MIKKKSLRDGYLKSLFKNDFADFYQDVTSNYKTVAIDLQTNDKIVYDTLSHKYYACLYPDTLWRMFDSPEDVKIWLKKHPNLKLLKSYKKQFKHRYIDVDLLDILYFIFSMTKRFLGIFLYSRKKNLKNKSKEIDKWLKMNQK